MTVLGLFVTQDRSTSCKVTINVRSFAFGTTCSASGWYQAKLPPSGVRTQSAPWFGRFSSIVPRVRVSSANVVPEWSLFVIILTLLRCMAGLVFRLGGRDGGSLMRLKLWVNVREVCFLGLRGQASQ